MFQTTEPLNRYLADYTETGDRLCLCPTKAGDSFTLRIFDEESSKGTMILAHFGKSLPECRATTKAGLKKALEFAKHVCFETPSKFQAAHCVNEDTGEEYVAICRPGSVEVAYVQPEASTATPTVVE